MPIQFIEPRLILCEGASDKWVLRELIRVRGLTGFQVQFPCGSKERTGGVSKFGRFLSDSQLNEGFITEVEEVLVVADKDEDRDKSFEDVQEQVKAAGFSVPMTEFEFVPSPKSVDGLDLPRIGIALLPLDKVTGTLETLCLESAESKWDSIVAPLDTFQGLTPARNWRQAYQEKMRLQCILAATCEENPYCTVGSLFKEKEQYHLPLDHTCFDSLAEKLKKWAEGGS